jgi:CCR4-NOT transcription complex subunit 1
MDAAPSQAQWPARKTFDAAVEAEANSHLQRVYSELDSIPGLIEKMRTLRHSGDPRQTMIYDCIVHNLLDEYRFFPKYPQKELGITGVLFGSLIQNLLLPSEESANIALGYLCEALQQPSNDKMFAFGICTLEQAKWRIHEFPQHCAYILQLPRVAEAVPDTLEVIRAALSRQQQSTGGALGPFGGIDGFAAGSQALDRGVVQWPG